MSHLFSSGPRLFALVVSLVLVAGSALGDTIVLKDGRRIPGTVLRKTAKTLVVKTSLGEVTFDLADVVEIVKEKTPQEVFDDKMKRAKSAEDFCKVADWAVKKRLKSLAKRAWQRAIEVDTNCAPARTALGFVLYKDEWMTPEERDRRQAADLESEMRARGMVPWKDQWVTPEEHAKLEAGLIFHDGEWMTPGKAKRLQGLGEYKGEWLPAHEAHARKSVDEAGEAAGIELDLSLNAEAVVAGTFSESLLEDVGEKLVEGRDWFNAYWDVAPGLDLFGGRLAEFYLWDRDPDPYQRTTLVFSTWTHTLPDGWAAHAIDTHGFYWSDPYPLSSARLWHRDEHHLVGHCLHHWGHLLINRLGYSGSLLPPWYDEAVAAMVEFRDFGENTIFCQVSSTGGTGTGAGAAATQLFDPKFMSKGRWREALEKSLEAGAIGTFDRMAALEFSELEHIDIATGMAVIEWLETRDPGALQRFHGVLREQAPMAPDRVLRVARERQARYDAAFGAAVKMGWRQADREWRDWFLKR